MTFKFVTKPLQPGLYEVEGIYLTTPFEGRHPITQLWGENPDFYKQFKPGGVPLKGHNGIDFGLPTGTKLLATDAGQVIEIGTGSTGFGRYVKLQHWWGESLYGHMQGFSIESGQWVKRGQLIGFSDNTGTSTGPHLHFGIRINPYSRSDGWGGFSDPLPFMDPVDIILPPYARRIRVAGR
jgi:murein DD-endopeptidase MepM/ murein hydrolase activator NlpD